MALPFVLPPSVIPASGFHFPMAPVWVNIFCGSDLALNFTTRNKTVPWLKLPDSSCLRVTAASFKSADQLRVLYAHAHTNYWSAFIWEQTIRWQKQLREENGGVFFGEVRKDTLAVFDKRYLNSEESWLKATNNATPSHKTECMFCKKSHPLSSVMRPWEGLPMLS